MLDGNTIWPGLTTIGGGGGGGGNISAAISGTFAQFAALMDSNTLVAGQSYIITDFETIYDRPDYEDVMGNIVPKGTIETVTARPERLIVYAMDGNAISPLAYSLSSPNDILWYDPHYRFTIVNNSPAKGRIVYREDTLKQIALNFDWRAVTFKRYDHGDGLGFVWYYDDGMDSSVLLPPLDAATSSGLYIPGLVTGPFTGFDLPNLVITGAAIIVRLQAMDNSTTGNMTSVNMRQISNSIVGNGMINVSMGDINTSVIGPGFRAVTSGSIENLNLLSSTLIYLNFDKSILRSQDGTTTYVSYVDNFGSLETDPITS
jgi:hypothetical protein